MLKKDSCMVRASILLCGLLFFCTARVEASATGKAENLKAATYVGSEVCATCHEKQVKEFKTSAHAKIFLDDDSIEGGVMNSCELCHGPGSIHVDAGGGKGTMINLSKDSSTCFKCHMDKKVQFSLPYTHPVLEGKMGCASCHNLHGPDIKGGSVASLDSINDTCFKCHGDKQGPFVFEHEALREGCVTCHQVHGSINDKMLTQRDNNLCLRCHTQVNFPTIGKSGHGTRLPQGACFSAGCHTAIHGSNFDDHLRY